ncbi:unnamed protein product [Heligmosomoides polygyrus]|uniref:PKD_channel domain-containing protein n=1 Tax=Heligmosomoides polygyrus TaxID=6339 RepID=A0A3P8D2N8_HELPZ|nr:unnamed protein product [Heligmosomoides polygyrus]
MSNVNYRDVVYENPPNVAEPPGHDIHTLSTERDLEPLVAGPFGASPGGGKRNETRTKCDLLLPRDEEKCDDGTMKLTVRSVFKMVNYACFLALVTYVALEQSSVQTYYFTKTIGDLFVSSKSAPTRKMFTEISCLDDIWAFLEVEFLSSLYNTDAPSNVDEVAMVYYNNKLLGQPRLRMLKVFE